LGTLPDRLNSFARAVSANGSVVVGYASNFPYEFIAFRWENNQIQSLGTLPDDTESIAFDISGDASIIVGGSQNPFQGRYRAVIWRNEMIQDMNTLYSDLLTDGSILQYAYGISTNGRYIVGTGINASTGRQEAFLIDTFPTCNSHDGDVDANGCVDDADLLAVLFIRHLGRQFRA
ncbi:MAG: hypothetical protein NZM28_09070, partial [Fimbriimonadales bacterium]|nr:hypothetical protein [Fimbriimonadales bacterium]